MKKTVFSQLEVLSTGVIQVRLEKQTFDGEKMVVRDYHRTSLEPGDDLDAQMAAVNAHLAQMGYPPVDPDSFDRVRAIVAVEHKPARVAAFRAARERGKA